MDIIFDISLIILYVLIFEFFMVLSKNQVRYESAKIGMNQGNNLHGTIGHNYKYCFNINLIHDVSLSVKI